MNIQSNIVKILKMFRKIFLCFAPIISEAGIFMLENKIFKNFEENNPQNFLKMVKKIFCHFARINLKVFLCEWGFCS